MSRLYLDTETVGLHGTIALLQYAYDDAVPTLWTPWHKSVISNINLFTEIINTPSTLVGYNLAYDVFHLAKFFTTLILLEDKSRLLEDCVKDMVRLEKQARFGPCIKFASVLDLMLHARKTEFQSLMNRKDISILKIPSVAAESICLLLNKETHIDDIYFAKHADPSRRWVIHDHKDPRFKNIVLSFASSTSLKAFTQYVLKTKTIKYDEVARKYKGTEFGYAPCAGDWGDYVLAEAEHWAYSAEAREYAANDIIATRDLDNYFNNPEPNDVDSILACAVGVIRWHGYNLDLDAIRKRRDEKQAVMDSAELQWSSVDECKKYLLDALSDTERTIVETRGTGKMVLEELSKWHKAEVCKPCSGLGCDLCKYEGMIESTELHEAAKRAKHISMLRRTFKEIELYDKLLLAGRFHASFNIIGTKSSRMSGDNDLNAQGINKSSDIRKMFALTDPGYVLCGGDFSAFEVVLMDAAYNDPDLRAELLSGKKIHGLFGTYLFPGNTYEDILKTDGLPGTADLYTRSKSGVFALGYGGTTYTLVTKTGVSEEAAKDAFERWTSKYKVWGRKRKEYEDMFCSMRQPNGQGTAVVWHEPADYIESIFGFRRYFTLENAISKMLYNLAQTLKGKWEGRVVRNNREQTIGGACQSAFYGAAFRIQARNMRAAGNHVIQSSGATLTKGLQAHLWELQPVGIHQFRILPMNVHDEIMAPMLPELVPLAEKRVKEFIDHNKTIVPLLKMDWKSGMSSWAEKKK